MRVAVLLLFPAILPADDSLVLRSGPPVNGTYQGGAARSVRFLVGDQVKVFPISEVVRVVFDNASAPCALSWLDGSKPSTPEGTMGLSERNQLPGTIEDVRLGEIMAHVVVRVGESVVESVITRTSAEELDLKKGIQSAWL
jgi:molybdopterin-binding protein